MGDHSVHKIPQPSSPRSFDIPILHDGHFHFSVISRHRSILRSYEPKPRAGSTQGLQDGILNFAFVVSGIPGLYCGSSCSIREQRLPSHSTRRRIWFNKQNDPSLTALRSPVPYIPPSAKLTSFDKRLALTKDLHRSRTHTNIPYFSACLLLDPLSRGRVLSKIPLLCTALSSAVVHLTDISTLWI